jgi:O-antigen/teichoic acid export membrane protein
MLLSIFIARLLGDIDLGKYYIAIALPMLFLVFLDLGYETFLLREVARDKSLASKYLSYVFTFRLLLFPIIIFMILITVNLLGYPESTKQLLYLFSIYYVILSLSGLFRVTFRAFEKMEYEAIITAFTSTLRIILSLLFLYLGYGLIEIAFIFIFSGIIDLFICYIICIKKFAKPKLEIDISFIKKSIKIALPLAMVSIFSLIYVKIDTIMLSYMKGDAVVGWYNAAYSLTLGFSPIPTLMMSALFPILCHYYVSSKESLKMAYDKSFKYLFYLGLPLAIGIFMLADRFIFFFYGSGFSNSIVALKILAWDILLQFLYLCSSYILISTDKQKQMTIIVIFSALLNVILNLFLIPSYSYVGSGIATLITEFFILICYLYLNARNSFTLNIKKFLFQPIIACGFMAFFLYLFPEIQLVLRIILAIIIYFSILFITKGFSKEDFQLFRRLIKKDKDRFV